MCLCDKVEHPTREAALDAQKRLVYDNHLRGRDELSAGLNVYPCPHGAAWHYGHSSLSTPTAWHYDRSATLEALLHCDAFVPPKPVRTPQRMRRRHHGAVLAAILDVEDRSSGMLWFTWNAAWNFTGIPHPGVFVTDPVDEGEEFVRLGVPASLIKLRWGDYLKLNGHRRVLRGQRVATQAEGCADWLATDRPIEVRVARAIEVYRGGAWVDAAAET